MCMGNLRHLLNIYNIRIGISQRFNVKRLGVLLNSILYCLHIKGVYEGSGNTVIYQCMCQQVIGSAVNIIGRYNMIPGFCQVLNGIGNCCHTASYCQRCRTAFQCGNSLFKHILCGICQTSVNISAVCQSESCGCMVAVAKYIRRSLINRYCSRICYRVGLLLPYM